MRRLDATMILRGVREIASLADAENPVQVSQRRWDQAREQSKRYARLPKAREIAWQLRIGWREVLLLAHSPSSTHAHRLGRAQTSAEQDWLTDSYIAFVLKLVARRLGISSVSPVQYRIERERMLALDRTRWLHGQQLLLPSDEQIMVALGGDWTRALALAELATRVPPTGRAPGTVALLERCYQAHSTEPTAAELRMFARANGIPWNPDKTRTWLESVAAWKQERRERGLDVPAGPPPRAQRPDYAQDLGAAVPGEQRRRDWSNVENCLPFIIAYLEQLPAGGRSTKRAYQAWAYTHTSAPHPSAFDQHEGGWGRLRALAQARMLESED